MDNRKNGCIIDGIRYNRTYDFDRDSWYVLVNKLVSWSNKGKKKKFIPTIKNIIRQRIKKGSCTEEQVIKIIEKK